MDTARQQTEHDQTAYGSSNFFSYFYFFVFLWIYAPFNCCYIRMVYDYVYEEENTFFPLHITCGADWLQAVQFGHEY